LPDSKAESERLAKRVAAMVPCSRSEAEAYIEGGFVRVDGRLETLPQARVTTERIEIEPGARAVAFEPVTLLMNKPAGMTMQEALQAMKSQPPAGSASPRPIARHFAHQAPLLEMPDAASGLVVFSQVRGVVRRLTEDAPLIEQEIVAQVEGTIAPGGLARLAHGLVYRGGALPPIKVSWQSETRLRFALKGIVPQRVAWMCEQVGLRMTAMKRLRIGRLALAGLPEGQWRFLLPTERF
jgi:23S rRNA pseudouridine2604 synthase